jgi:hypothetical protein
VSNYLSKWYRYSISDIIRHEDILESDIFAVQTSVEQQASSILSQRKSPVTGVSIAPSSEPTILPSKSNHDRFSPSKLTTAKFADTNSQIHGPIRVHDDKVVNDDSDDRVSIHDSLEINQNNSLHDDEPVLVPRLPPGADPNGPHPGDETGTVSDVNLPVGVPTHSPRVVLPDEGVNHIIDNPTPASPTRSPHHRKESEVVLATITFDSISSQQQTVNITCKGDDCQPPSPAEVVINLLSAFSNVTAAQTRDRWWEFFFHAASLYRDIYRVIDEHAESFTDAFQYTGVSRRWLEQAGFWGPPGTPVADREAPVPIRPISYPTLESIQEYKETYPNGENATYTWFSPAFTTGMLAS